MLLFCGLMADPLATVGVALASLSDSGLSDTDEGFDRAWTTLPASMSVDDLFAGAGLPSRSRSRSPHRLLNDLCNADGAPQNSAGGDVVGVMQNWTLDDSDSSSLSVGPPGLVSESSSEAGDVSESSSRSQIQVQMVRTPRCFAMFQVTMFEQLRSGIIFERSPNALAHVMMSPSWLRGC